MVRSTKKPTSLNFSDKIASVTCIIDLNTPVPTASCTATSDTFDGDFPSDDEDDGLTTDSSLRIEPPQPTVVERMVSVLLAAEKTKASQEAIFAGEAALLDHLHTTPATLATVEAIVPALNCHRKIIDMLAENLGFYHLRGQVSECEVEHVLEHVLMKGDPQHRIFERTKTQIEYFRRQDPGWHHRALEQRSKAREQREKARREAKHRRKSIPAEYKLPGSLGCLPYGCSSIADIITEVDGMSWAEARKMSSKANTTLIMVKLKTEVSNIETGSWARTRLHNGPGLTDRKKPVVCLPQADARQVTSMPDDLIVARKTKEDRRNHLCAKTKSTPEFFFVRKRNEAVVVRLAPP